MKIKFGAIVVAGRGKIGGHVASRNRAGAYLRTKVTPVNPNTTFQQGVRNRLSGLSSAWRALTAVQILAWNAAVSAFAKTDIFGDLKNPTGFNLFQRLNNNLLTVGEAQISDVPASEAVDALATMSIAAAEGAGTLTITYTDAIAANMKAKVFATPALSPGVSFVKSEYRLIDIMAAADVTPFSIETEYEAKFGAIGAAGQKIFLKMVLVNTDTGQEGIPIQASAVIAA